MGPFDRIVVRGLLVVQSLHWENRKRVPVAPFIVESTPTVSTILEPSHVVKGELS